PAPPAGVVRDRPVRRPAPTPPLSVDPPRPRPCCRCVPSDSPPLLGDPNLCMELHVFAPSHHHQILGSVVRLITVDVMNNLVITQRTTDQSFSDQLVFGVVG